MVSKSNYYSFRSLFLIFVTLCFAGSIAAQTRGILPDMADDAGLGGANIIQGTVILPSNQRLEKRVRVRLVTPTRGDLTSMTDDGGKFSFRGLVSGNYVIVIDNEPEFDAVNEQVEIRQGRGMPAQIYPMNIRLSPKSTIGYKPGVINSEFADVPKGALDNFTKAQELSKAGDHKGAIEKLQLAVTEYPKFMPAFNEMGLEYSRINEAQKADEAFQEALKLKPDSFSPLMNRGMLLVLSKQYLYAEPLLRQAVKIKEQSAPAQYFFGVALANLGKFDEAEKHLVSSISLGGDEVKEAHRILAIIYSSRGDKKKAVGELETYLKLFPTTPDAEQLRQTIDRLKGTTTPATTSQTKPSQ